MKRSEMIDLMAKEFLKNVGSTTAKKVAEDMLNAAEENGMLPPIEKSGKQYSVLCHWEPEENQSGAV